jgi:copper chaperone CopZ
MTTKINVLNVKCGGCADSIKKGLKSIPEVSDIQVDVPSGLVEVTYADSLPVEKIREKLSSIGYPAKN